MAFCDSEFYQHSELAQVIAKTAQNLILALMKMPPRVLSVLEAHPERQPLLRRTRDYAQLAKLDCINLDTAQVALQALDIDDHGLDHMDWHLLNNIQTHFSGGPVGLDTLAANLGEEKQTIEDVIEPYLIQQGFIQRTARGRMITQKAEHYLHNHSRLSTETS